MNDYLVKTVIKGLRCCRVIIDDLSVEDFVVGSSDDEEFYFYPLSDGYNLILKFCPVGDNRHYLLVSVENETSLLFFCNWGFV